MTLASLIPIVLKVSIALTVVTVGLSASVAAMTYLLRRPGLLVRSLLAMNVVVLAVAILIVRTFDLAPAVKIALIALSVSPVPPLLSFKTLKAGGHASYTIGLLTTTALLAIVLVPLSLEMLKPLYDFELQISIEPLVKLVVTTVLGPLALGVAIKTLAPALAARCVKPLTVIAMGLLLASVLPILVTMFPAIRSLIGNGTLAAIVAFIVAGLVAGFALGGPDSESRTVLAFASSSRHPGIALVIAQSSFPDEKLAPAAILLYLLVNVIVGLPVIRWAKRRHAAAPGPTPVRGTPQQTTASTST